MRDEREVTYSFAPHYFRISERNGRLFFKYRTLFPIFHVLGLDVICQIHNSRTLYTKVQHDKVKVKLSRTRHESTEGKEKYSSTQSQPRNVTFRPIYARGGTTVPIEWKAEHDEGYVKKSVKLCMSCYTGPVWIQIKFTGYFFCCILHISFNRRSFCRFRDGRRGVRSLCGERSEGNGHVP